MRQSTRFSERATIFRRNPVPFRRFSDLRPGFRVTGMAKRSCSDGQRRAGLEGLSATAATSTGFSELDGDLELGDHAGACRDPALGPDSAGSEHPKLPVTWRRIEGEPAVLAERDLCHKLAVGVQQPRVPG